MAIKTTPNSQQARTALKKNFIEALMQTGNVSESVKQAGTYRRTVYDWKKTDEAFAAAWEDALEHYADSLEFHADDRAKGWLEPIFDKEGNVVGHKRKYSDLLLMFRLKAIRPEKYRERIDQNVTGNVTVGLTMNFAKKKTDEPK
jgi:hypothetical protein